MANLYYKLIVFMLGSLGMSCERSSTVIEYGPPVVEYGMPFASYMLSGQVVKATDQSPLNGIEVTFLDSTIVSDSTGTWSLDIDNYQPCGFGGFPICSLYIDDIDGPFNGGEFEPTLVALELIQTEDGGSFYYGMFEQHGITIELNEYGPIPEYGVPVASYKLSAQVVKAADQSPLNGIELTFLGSTIVSDGTGTWSLDLNNFMPCGFGGFPICSLYINDVDGPANGGEFEPTQVALELIQTEDGGTLYYGMFEQHAITTELDEVTGE